MSAEGDDEYNAALDANAGGAEDAGPEEADDTGAEAVATAEALGITEAPSQKTQGLLEAHPELYLDYEEAVLEKLVIREAYPPIGNPDAEGKIPNHTTYPFLTLYERTKVLELRAAQLAGGSTPFIDVPGYLTDAYEIAKAELEAKRLPFILKRPLPNGDYEYWRLADLMLL
jgi:DNA-directed RNA polymerase I, II, and III subunit RPABC2